MIPVSITARRGWRAPYLCRLAVSVYRTQIFTVAASVATARPMFEVFGVDGVATAPVTVGCSTACVTFYRRLEQLPVLKMTMMVRWPLTARLLAVFTAPMKGLGRYIGVTITDCAATVLLRNNLRLVVHSLTFACEITTM